MKWMQWQRDLGETWEKHLEKIITHSKGKSINAQLFKMIYTEFVYAIWIERNMRIFEEKRRQWELIAKEIAYMVNLRATEKGRIKLQQLVF